MLFKRKITRFYQNARVINIILPGLSYDIFGKYLLFPISLFETNSTFSTPSSFSVCLFDNVETLVIHEFSKSKWIDTLLDKNTYLLNELLRN